MSLAWPDRDPCICYCMHVHRRELVAAIRAGATTLEALRRKTRAGTGCATCRLDLLMLLAEHAPGGFHDDNDASALPGPRPAPE